jgi:hypothetical protein
MNKIFEEKQQISNSIIKDIFHVFYESGKYKGDGWEIKISDNGNYIPDDDFRYKIYKSIRTGNKNGIYAKKVSGGTYDIKFKLIIDKKE